jgi:hypothetical protein
MISHAPTQRPYSASVIGIAASQPNPALARGTLGAGRLMIFILNREIKNPRKVKVNKDERFRLSVIFAEGRMRLGANGGQGQGGLKQTLESTN